MTIEQSIAVVTALRTAGIDLRDDMLSRALYSTDASLYRVVPQLVALPRNADDVSAILAACREEQLPITSRGAGTSCAGNAVGPGVVVDFSRYMNAIVDVDAGSRTAVVQPGVVQAALQRAAAPAGLRYGPDPSSLSRCTIGGSIGNNACGSRALAYGRTSDNVVAMDLLTGRGNTLRVTTGIRAATPTQHGADAEVAAVRAVAASHLATIRTEFGRFGRQVSGYALEHLTPEHHFDLGRMMVGSEGTLAIVTEATVALVSEPAVAVLVVLGFDNIGAAGDVAHLLKPLGAVAAEGIDRRIVDVMIDRRGPAAVPELPVGAAWLFVEVSGDTVDEALAAADRVTSQIDSLSARVVVDPNESQALWRIRQDGAGLAARSPRNRPAHAGWEDAAVPPDQLGNYLRDFDALLAAHDLTGLPYGHFGEGCLHVRLDFDLDAPGGTDRYREFMLAAADLVATYGGSMSGEHGDGRARSELLPKMYSPDALAAFAEIKLACDPDNLLNPGVLVDPDTTDDHLRIPAATPMTSGLAYHYLADDGNFTQAVHRCTGVGKCRSEGHALSVMCPSYQATREEKDSTRGRARILQELTNGGLITTWSAPEIRAALDLCLSCKGCASDCPTGIDMATYKSEALHQAYRRRLRPRTHYSLGWLPRWSRLASLVPRLANLVMAVPGLRGLVLRIAGVDHRRTIPPFAPKTLRQRWATELAEALRVSPDVAQKPVVVFTDTFTNHFTPDVGVDLLAVLRAAGYTPILPDRQECCGLTWISTGQLDGARKRLTRLVDSLAGFAELGIPIVGIEPSCTAVLRHDAVELLNTDDARAVAAATVTLAELLQADDDWRPPDLTGVHAVAQPHCHHNAIMGWGADAALLRGAGAQVRRVGSCCGLAGNFGVEDGHYEVSVAVAEQQLLPALRDKPDDAVVLADGFSCRTQIADLTSDSGEHLATVLARHLAQ